MMDRHVRASGDAPAPVVRLLGAALACGMLTACTPLLDKSDMAGDDFIRARPILGEERDYENLLSWVGSHPATEELDQVQVDPIDLGEPELDYRIEAGDVLNIRVFREPGLEDIQSRVDGGGYIQQPMVGEVKVAGKTAREVQTALEEAYGQFMRDPWITVEVASFASKPLYLIGQMNNPGVVFMDRPTNMLQAIARAGGLQPTADLRGVRVMRDQEVLPVDVYALLREGDFSQNLWLKGDDTIFVPSYLDSRVWMLGRVAQRGPVQMVDGELNLTQAIALAGGVTLGGGDIENVRIIRSLSQTRGQLIVVNYKMLTRGEAMPFPLMNGDVVIIPDTRLQTWNATIQSVLPSLQFFGSVLQPFVQIQFLAESVNGDNNN